MNKKILSVILLITLISCENTPRKGVNGVKHCIYQIGSQEYYTTSEIVYNGGCAMFIGFSWSDTTRRELVICGNFVQQY